MKQDLDRLMEERGLDAAVVAGHTYGNPTLVYLLNGAEVSQGIVVKKRGEEAVFIHSPIERDEAVATGLRLVNMAKYDFVSILREKEDRLEATVELYRRIFAELEVRGEVGFYGIADRGQAYLLLKALDETLPDVHVRGEVERGLFDVARETKDATEIAQMQEVARLTIEVMQDTVQFLRQHRIQDETLVTDDGSPLTVGRVKQHILRLLAERRMEDPEGVIFAIGRDAGVPHSKGRTNDPIRLGQTIVYDLFPRRPGGYFFDCTRTFCLGYAPPEVEQVYQDVKECVQAVIDAVEVGVEARRLQQVACAFFEERGHPTIAGDPKTEEGFVHSVGHGLGLAVHEEPAFSDVPSNTRTLQPGHVFTVEPGLYYPERGYGVRIEDVVWIDEAGKAQNLTELPKELIVEL
ncbi:MAG TPA: aminopeptidase P family protein [Anaerolineales bacterium]|nr:aminopeptidase P family protein [Anaerolineae bacterium]HIQ00659.1 aminopeptidase P family protein [Anaerolineales bacterium]